jgi:hypothetical protein
MYSFKKIFIKSYYKKFDELKKIICIFSNMLQKISS